MEQKYQWSTAFIETQLNYHFKLIERTLFYQLIAMHRNIKKIAESFIFLRCCQDSEEIIQVCGSISTPVSSKWDFLASFNISF